MSDQPAGPFMLRRNCSMLRCIQSRAGNDAQVQAAQTCRLLLRLIVLVPILAAAATAAYLLRPPAKAPAAAARTPPAVPVVAGVAEARDVPIYLTGIGTVQAFNT